METKDNSITYKVIASSVEEFKNICEIVDVLPYDVKKQILTAEKTLIGVDCTLKFS